MPDVIEPDEDELPDPFPTDGLTPRGVHQADQIVADAKAIAKKALDENLDPDEATAAVFDKLIELRDVGRKPEP